MKRNLVAKFVILCAGATFAMGACAAPANPPMQDQGYPQGGPQGGYAPGRMQGGDTQGFYNNLSPDAKRKFDQLSPRQQEMVRQAIQNGQDSNRAIDEQFRSQNK